MTSLQRIQAAFRHREPDRTPVFEYVLLSPLADRLLGRPYALDDSHWPAVLKERGFEDAVRQVAIDRLDLALTLGHDMMYVWPNPAPPSTTPQPSPPPVAAPAPDDPVERLRLRNDLAAASDPTPPDSCFLVYIFLKEEMARRGIDLPIFAPAWNHGVWTDTDLMETMLLAPAVAHRHYELATVRSIALVDAYARLRLDMSGVGGDFAGNRPIISPDAYRSFIMPEVRSVSRRIHAAGMWAVNASDGNLWSVIDDYLIGCEVDACAEIDLHAGMDLRRLKAAYGRRITFLGNLDCGNTLSFASPAEVRRHVIDCLEAGQGDGGHILCASNAITASVPLVNYLAAVSAYRDFFHLPAFRLD